MVNIAVSHTAAQGSIPCAGSFVFSCILFCFIFSYFLFISFLSLSLYPSLSVPLSFVPFFFFFMSFLFKKEALPSRSVRMTPLGPRTY